MAIPLIDNITVGLYPLPATAPRASSVALVPAGVYELKPVASIIPDTEPNYVQPYEPFSIEVSAVPNIPDEKIISLTVTGPTYCVLEEPLPSFDSTRSLDAELEISASPLWVSGAFQESFIVNSTTASGLTPVVTISGYYSERNFYDREWLLRYPDAIAKISGNGVQYELLEVINKQEEIFDPSMLVKTYPSSISAETFYPLSPADAKLYDSSAMINFISNCSDILSYKPSDIRKLRMFFEISIVSDKGTYPFTAHMTVQNNMESAIERLRYAINTPKAKKPLINAV